MVNDWGLVGGDPAPGNVARLRGAIGDLKRTTTTIDDARHEILSIARNTSGADWQGMAADAMSDLLEELAQDLEPVVGSFNSVGSALGTYAAQLDDLQARARQALNRAHAAKARQDAANRTLADARGRLSAQQAQVRSAILREQAHHAELLAAPLVDPSRVPELSREQNELQRRTAEARRIEGAYHTEVARRQADVSNAIAELTAEQSAIKSIHKKWEGDSEAAARSVNDALASSLRNPNALHQAWNKVGQFAHALENFARNPLDYLADIRKIIDDVTSILSKVSFVVGLLGKICAFIPGLQGLAVALTLVAFALSIAALALSLVKLVCTATLLAYGNDAQKKGLTFGDLVGDGVDVGLSIVGAKSAKGALTEAKTAAGIAETVGIKGTAKVAFHDAKIELGELKQQPRQTSRWIMKELVTKRSGTTAAGSIGEEMVEDFGKDTAADYAKKRVVSAVDGEDPSRGVDVDLDFGVFTQTVHVPPPTRPLVIPGVGAW